MADMIDAVDLDRALKARHRTVWGLGDYPTVAAGSGNAAIPAALAGADVVASDLTPELLEAVRPATPAGRTAPERPLAGSRRLVHEATGTSSR